MPLTVPATDVDPIYVRITNDADRDLGGQSLSGPQHALDPTRVIAPWRRDRLGLVLVAYESVGSTVAVVAVLSDNSPHKLAAIMAIAVGTVLGDVWLRWLRRQIRSAYPVWRSAIRDMLGRGPRL